MNESTSGVTCDSQEIQSLLRKRKKTFIEKTVSASNLPLARKKAELEVQDGWSIQRENMRSIRLKKEKPIEEILEDEIWCILAKMGFDTLSKDRNFTVCATEGTPGRQIDIFAKDENTAIFIECTCTKDYKRKKLKPLIEKIQSLRKRAFDEVNAHYGREPKLKMKWGIATRNIQWRDVDENLCREENIFILKDTQIDYFYNLTQLLKFPAKYQFLAHVFRSEDIPGLELIVPATQGTLGKRCFYNFLLDPEKLLRIAYISHKVGSDPSDIETYQRMLKPSRLKDIGHYIDHGGHFPTNIIINLKSTRKLRFDRKEKIGKSAYGTLYLPAQYASAWVVDGQHRLYGYAYSQMRTNRKSNKLMFPVLAYVDLPSDLEKEMFIDINCKQVKVSRNLLNEIYANLQWESDNPKERLEALRSRIALSLNQENMSPFHQRVIVTNTKKTSTRCITINTLIDGLKENKLLGEPLENDIAPGYLSVADSQDLIDSHNKAVEVISLYFDLFKHNTPNQWALGNDVGGFLYTNNGTRALLRVLREILAHISREYGISPENRTAGELDPYITEIMTPLVQYFSDAEPSDFLVYRNRTSLKGVTQNAMDMLRIIHEANEDFLPKRLKDYLDTVDHDGTKDCVRLINEIQQTLYQFVMKRLNESFGENWWYDGVPEPVRKSCSAIQEEERGTKEKHQYMHLIDYHVIADRNWEVFKDSFSLSNAHGKKKQLEWLKELNTIRNITHHVEKWPATKEQVAFVRRMYAEVMKRFADHSIMNPYN